VNSQRGLAQAARLAVASMVFLAGVAGAQSTGSPVYAAPYRAFVNSEAALSLSEPGSGFDLEGSYRTGLAGAIDLGGRVGMASLPGSPRLTDLLLGGDLRARVITHNESIPVDGSFTVGLGVETGHHETVGRVPLGLSFGRRLLIEGSSVSLVPYVQPVLSLLFGDATGSEFSLGFGVDTRVSARLDLRFSAAVGHTSGIGFTAAFLH
jgi:hypothetical protein